MRPLEDEILADHVVLDSDIARQDHGGVALTTTPQTAERLELSVRLAHEIIGNRQDFAVLDDAVATLDDAKETVGIGVGEIVTKRDKVVGDDDAFTFDWETADKPSETGEFDGGVRVGLPLDNPAVGVAMPGRFVTAVHRRIAVSHTGRHCNGLLF
jgi:hypothetical protein